MPDLHHLLTARGHQLDYQLYSQTDILQTLLRKVITTHNTRTRCNNHHICLQELNSVTVKTSQSGYSSQDLLSYPDDFSTVTETTSESYSLLSTSSADYSFDTSSISSYKASSVTKSLSFATDEKISSESWNLLTSENFPVYSIFSIPLFFLLLFFTILLIIIVRRKCSLQKKSKSKDKIQIKNDLHNYKRPH